MQGYARFAVFRLGFAEDFRCGGAGHLLAGEFTTVHVSSTEYKNEHKQYRKVITNTTVVTTLFMYATVNVWLYI